jgi:hypothetical protein
MAIFGTQGIHGASHHHWTLLLKVDNISPGSRLVSATELLTRCPSPNCRA